MGNYQIELLPLALEDLNDIVDYILLENPLAAEQTLAEIMNSIQQLEVFPEAGVRLIEKSLKVYDFRMVILDPYIVFYRFIDNMVYVYRILHGARDYIKLLKQNE